MHGAVLQPFKVTCMALQRFAIDTIGPLVAGWIYYGSTRTHFFGPLRPSEGSSIVAIAFNLHSEELLTHLSATSCMRKKLGLNKWF